MEHLPVRLLLLLLINRQQIQKKTGNPVNWNKQQKQLC